MITKEQQIARRQQRRMEQKRQNGMWAHLLAEIAAEESNQTASRGR